MSVYQCRYCGGTVDQLQPGFKTGDPMFCTAHHALADRDPVAIGLEALDYAQWLNDLPADALVRWPWQAVNALTGPLVPGRLTYVAAFPGGGKTSYLTQCLDFWLKQGKRVLYMPLEANPGEVYARLACLELGLSADDVLSLRMRMRADSGDVIAQQHIARITTAYTAMKMDRRLMEALRIEPVDALNVKTFTKALQVAHASECDLVVVDHVDHVEQVEGEPPMAGIAISDHLQGLALRAAKGLEIPVVLATQLNPSRTGRDKLATHRPPVVDWLYNPGKKNQMAAYILGLSYLIDPAADSGHVDDARDGKRDVSTVTLPHTMGVTRMKGRYGSAISERTVRLSYHGGILRDQDDDEGRAYASSRHGIPTGSPSMRGAA